MDNTKHYLSMVDWMNLVSNRDRKPPAQKNKNTELRLLMIDHGVLDQSDI